MLHVYSGAIIIGTAIIIYLFFTKLTPKLFFLCIAILLLLIHIPKDEVTPIQEKEVSFHLKRESDLKKGEINQSFIATIEKQNVLVFAPSHFQIELYCSGTGSIKPVDTAETNRFRYYYLSHKIDYQLTVKKITCHPGNDFLSPQLVRDSIKQQFTHYGETGSLYYMLLFGGNDETIINTQLWQSLGIIHLISLSGLQIHFIFNYFARIYQFFPIGEKARKRLNISLLLCYAFLSIHAIAFLRVITVKFLGEIGFKTYPLTLQVITTWLFLLIWPENYYSIGFWFSVLMQLSLIICQMIAKKYHISNWKVKVLTAIILFFQTLIICFLYNLPISPMYLISNMFFISAFEYVILPVILCGILFLPIQSQIITILQMTDALLTNLVFYTTNKIIHLYEALITLLCLTATSLVLIFKKRLSVLILAIILPATLIVSSLIFVPRIFTNKIIFLDVGQGDSAIVFLAEKQQLIVIDTGPPNSAYLSKLKSYLYTFGKTHIDYLVITHADSDHAGNAEEVLKDSEIEPKTLLLPNTTRSSKLLSIADANRKTTQFIDYTSQPFNTISEQNKLDITILNPGYHLEDENEESIVMHLRIGQNSILFQADAGIPFENKIPLPPQQVTLLKVAHHGSKSGSSASYIQKVKPQYSIISAAKNNIYHHPHPIVITTLEQEKSRILRTSERGDIHFECTLDKCYQTDTVVV